VRRTLILALALALAVTASASALAAAPPKPRTSLAEIEREVMCNVCGTPLNVSDSPQADRERAFIRTLIARGYTKKQVEDALVAQFGRGILDTPSDHGFDLAAYLVPGLALLLAGGVIGVAVTRWRRGRPASFAAAAGPSSKDGALLREDLERYDL
jgi:cytochrome c-type biogenesis protein CcmH/NrfF